MTQIAFDISTKTFPNTWAIIDETDLPLLAGRKWHAAKRRNGFYVVGKRGRQAVTYLHRLLMDAPRGMEVDHIDGNPLNNSRGNLRLCSHAENMRLSGLRRFGPPPAPKPQATPKPHVVRMSLADGTVREYVYPPRSKRARIEAPL